MNKKQSIKMSCGDCPIRHRAICARCDESELSQLEHMKSYKTFAAGEVIHWRGEPLEFVSSIVSGVASLSKTLDDGRTQMVGLLLPSDFIGKPGRTEIAFDLTANTDVTLCRFERKAFEDLTERTPNVAYRLLEMTMDELDSAREWMVLLGRKTAREKIATFIQMLAKRDLTPEQQGNDEVELPMTRDQIANYLGLTLETVSRQVNSLKADNIISLSGRRKIKILEESALRSASGEAAV